MSGIPDVLTLVIGLYVKALPGFLQQFSDALFYKTCKIWRLNSLTSRM